jgi:hypothetical protein
MEDEIEVEVEETQSISDQLSAAWDEAEETEDVDNDSGISDTTASQASGVSDEPIDDTKRAIDDKGVSGDQQSSGIEPVDSDSLEVAPKSLSPAAREEWKNAPESVRKEFKRMDDRMEGLAQKFGKNAQRAEQMDQAIAPFAQYMQMNGGPGQSIKGLLETGSMLQMGSPHQKAQVVAQIISQFGVDIQSLDNMLVGKGPSQEAEQNSQFQSMVNNAVAPMQQQLAGYQQRDQQNYQQQQQQIGSEIQTFANDPKNEFYSDVSLRMAEELEMASNAGRQLGLPDAYDLAVRANPEIFKIVQARQAAQSLGNKRKAATSIHGTQTGVADKTGAASLRNTIEDAWDNAGRM